MLIRIINKTLMGVSLAAMTLGYSASVKGVVKFDGKAPKMQKFNLGADPICKGKHTKPLTSEALVLGEKKTIGNVYVRISSNVPDKDYPIPKKPLVFDQKGCKYSPHVAVAFKGQKVEFLNPDGTMHNVHTLSKKNREINMAMPKFKKTATRKFKKTEGMFKVKCDVHPWMGAFLAVVDHPFFDVTEKDGAFEIKDLPAGKFTIEAWHEKLGTQTAEVTLKGNSEATINFTFKK